MSSGEVNLKNIERTEKYITEAGLNNSSAKLVPRNSVVIALAGQGKTRGKVARIRIALATNQSLAALTFDEKKFSSDYVFHFLETQYEFASNIIWKQRTRRTKSANDFSIQNPNSLPGQSGKIPCHPVGNRSDSGQIQRPYSRAYSRAYHA